jgi:imidazolonepropionase-like amidohydrolase
LNVTTFGSVAEQARGKFPKYADHMLALRDRLPGVVSAAHDAGVPIYVGTDAGGSLPHGLVAQEMVELTKAGLTNAEVVWAATWGAREWLGRPGLVEGEDADLVVYPSDPLADVGVVAAPIGVVLRGCVVV